MTLDSASNVSYAMAALGATELPEAPPLTAPQIAAQESVAAATRGYGLAQDLITRYRIPVILVSAQGRLPVTKDNEFYRPKGWQTFTADPAHLRKWTPDHGLALITGHGLDGVDVDTKNGASVDAERARLLSHGVHILGETRTPSGGAHFYVHTSGNASTNGGQVSKGGTGIDTRMGLPDDGESRGLLYMPGTRRPFYGGLGYAWVQPLDLLEWQAQTRDLPFMDRQRTAITAYLAEIGGLRTGDTVHGTVVAAEPISAMLLPPWLQAELQSTQWTGKTETGEGDRSERFYHLVGACSRADLTQGQALTLLTEWDAHPALGRGKYGARVAEQVAECWAKVAPETEAWKASKAATSTGGDVPRTSQTTGTLEDVQGPAQDDVGPEDVPRTWLPVDMGKYFDGTHVPERPTVGRREDGICLLYPGRTHSISGESEHGKSLVAQAIAVQVLQDGGNVLYLDFEKSPSTVAARLQALGLRAGVQPAGLTYVGPQAGLALVQNSADYRRLWSQPWTLVIIDGVTAAMGLIAGHVTGGPEAPWTDFYSQLPRRLAERTGAAVVLIDHVTKSQGPDNRYGYGSVHKLNAMTGVAFLCKSPNTPGIGRTGQVELIGAKDSESGLKRHCPRPVNHLWPAATFVFDSTKSTEDVAVTDWQILPPSASTGTRAAFRPTALMERASKYLEDESGPLSRTNLLVGIGGKKEYAVVALDVLISEGYVTRVEKGQKHLHTSVRAYRQAADPLSESYIQPGPGSAENIED